jgi:hypothetical protein
LELFALPTAELQAHLNENQPLKATVMIDKQTGREVKIKPNHSLFFIKMQYSAFIIAGIGIVMLCDILIHGKSSL